MAERESDEERRLEHARFQADQAVRNVSDISALNNQNNTVIMDRDADAVTLDQNNRIVSFLQDGRPILPGSDGRFSREVLDNFLRENQALANALDAKDAVVPTFTQSGRPIEREIDYNSR
jgi:hypothetical protein